MHHPQSKTEDAKKRIIEHGFGCFAHVIVRSVFKSIYLSDVVYAKVESLDVGHPEESSGHNLANQITTQVNVFQRSQTLQVNFFDGLKEKKKNASLT